MIFKTLLFRVQISNDKAIIPGMLSQWQIEQMLCISKGRSTIIIIYIYDNSYHNSVTPSPPLLQ